MTRSVVHLAVAASLALGAIGGGGCMAMENCPKVYGGTRATARVLDEEPKGEKALVWPLRALCALLDLPCTFALDTALFPIAGILWLTGDAPIPPNPAPSPACIHLDLAGGERRTHPRRVEVRKCDPRGGYAMFRVHHDGPFPYWFYVDGEPATYEATFSCAAPGCSTAAPVVRRVSVKPGVTASIEVPGP